MVDYTNDLSDDQYFDIIAAMASSVDYSNASVRRPSSSQTGN